MGIITLTTDLGLKDFYVACIKGAILSLQPQSAIVDISHNIKPFDIAQASFVLKNAYKSFPKGTAHIIGIDSQKENKVCHLMVQFKGQYFIGADNGIFSLILEEDQPDNIFVLNIPEEDEDIIFPTKGIFVKAACHVTSGGNPKTIGIETDEYQTRQVFRPIINENGIKGTFIYIDSYGNGITNITKDLFERIRKNRPFYIFFSRADYYVDRICDAYGDVPEGEKLALFGSSGYLEIAINKGVEGAGGGASQLFGLKLYDSIRIEFHDHKNR